MNIKQEIRRAFPKRSPISHKGDYGKVFLLCGSTGLTGAAYLASMGALRSGAGLVTLGIPKSLNPIMEVKLTEVMTFPVEDGGKGYFLNKGQIKILSALKDMDAVGLGSGLGRSEETFQLVRQLVRKIKKPLIIDADGLMAFRGKLSSLKASNAVITPHPGEFDAIFKTKVSSQPEKREEEALKIAKRYQLVVVLKGHKTVVASPGGDVYINETGNPGMASGGTGDCLTGMITAFLGMGIAPFDAAKFATYLHGLAGDMVATVIGEPSLIATDIIDFLPEAFYKVLK